MPFTPFHFGPGLLIQSAARRQFSLVAFITAQVLIDLEPGLNLLRHHHPVHGALHTYLGSLILVPVAALVARAWNRIFRKSPRRFSSLLISGWVGVWSHVLLDSLIHRDIVPFLPFSSSNPFYGAISYRDVYVGCSIAGIAGAAMWLWLRAPAPPPAR